MFDIQLRSLKDTIFDPCCHFVPLSVTPLHITLIAFLAGLLACWSARQSQILPSIAFWTTNRVLDCLDGALARHRNVASELGGFLDLLGDFIVYSLIPIAITAGQNGTAGDWMAVAVLESTFHINNFVLFYIAAVVEKSSTVVKGNTVKELTSVAMRPALIEGMESGIIFTMMLLLPERIFWWSTGMALLVAIGVLERAIWVVPVLGRLSKQPSD